MAAISSPIYTFSSGYLACLCRMGIRIKLNFNFWVAKFLSRSMKDAGKKLSGNQMRKAVIIQSALISCISHFRKAAWIFGESW